MPQELDNAFLDATKKNKLEDLEACLKKGVDVNTVDDEGRTALHWASVKNSVEAAGLLTQQQNININARDNKNYTPLHHAAWNKNFDMIKLLLDNGAEKDLQNDTQSTPLHEAVCRSNNHPTVALLLLHRSNEAILNCNVETALNIAERYKRPDYIAFFSMTLYELQGYLKKNSKPVQKNSQKKVESDIEIEKEKTRQLELQLKILQLQQSTENNSPGKKTTESQSTLLNKQGIFIESNNNPTVPLPEEDDIDKAINLSLKDLDKVKASQNKLS